MASSHTQHDGLHHAVSIDHHVHPPPPRDDLLSTDSDDEYEAQDSTTVGHDDLENIEKLSHGTRQPSLDSATGEGSGRSPNGSTSTGGQPFSPSLDSFDSLDDASSVREFIAKENDDGLDTEYPGASLPELTSSLSELSVTRSETMATVTTVVSHGVLQLDLSELCDLIAARSSLARAEIVSAECYVQRIGLINHRFLILHLRREGRKDIYLRIDRRAARDVSLTELVWASGQTHAQDEFQAILSPNKARLLGPGSPKVENHLQFEMLPTLGDLRLFLSVIVEELVVYKAWPENCWFFCSLVQQYLAASKHSTFSFGSLMHAGLAREVRLRIYERIRLIYNMPEPLSTTAILKGMQRSGDVPEAASKNFADAMKHSVRYDNQLMEDTSKEGPLDVSSIAMDLLYLSEDLVEAKKFKLACIIGEQSVFFHRIFANNYEWMWKSILGEALLAWGINLQKLWLMDKARRAIDEAVEVRKSRYKKKPDKHRPRLVDCLFVQCQVYHGSRDTAASAAVVAEMLPICQQLVRQDAKYLGTLARCYREQGFYLANLQRFGEGRVPYNEAIKRFRQLFKREPDNLDYKIGLALSLYHASDCLAGVQRYEESLANIDEAIKLYEETTRGEFELVRKFDLTQSLLRKAIALGLLGRFEDACTMDVQAIAGYRELYTKDPEVYRSLQISQSLVWYGDHLGNAERFEESLDAYRQSVLAARKHVNDTRRRFECDGDLWCAELALAYNQLKIALVKCMTYPEALLVAEQCVFLLRTAISRSFTHYEGDIAFYLKEYGCMLLRRRHFKEACKVFEEGSGIFRRLRHHNPVFRDYNLSLTLYEHNDALRHLFRHEDACLASAENVALNRGLYLDNPGRYRLYLARSLARHAESLFDLQRFPEACKDILEAAELYRVRYETHRTMTAYELASCLYSAGSILTSAEQDEQARPLYQEAADVYEEAISRSHRFYQCDEEPRAPDHGNILRRYGSSLFKLGRATEAVPLIQESVIIFRRAYSVDADANRENLSRSLLALAICHSKTEHFAESRDASAEALSLYRQLHADNPRYYGEAMSMSMCHLARSRTRLNQVQEAWEVLKEEKNLDRPFTTATYPSLAMDLTQIASEISGILPRNDVTSGPLIDH